MNDTPDSPDPYCLMTEIILLRKSARDHDISDDEFTARLQAFLDGFSKQ